MVCTGKDSEWAFSTLAFHVSHDYLIFDCIKSFTLLPGLLFSRLKHSGAFSCSLCANSTVPLRFFVAFLWTYCSLHCIFLKLCGWKNIQDCTKCSQWKSILALHSGKSCWVSPWLSRTSLNGTAVRDRLLWWEQTIWERAKCPPTVCELSA